MKPDDQVMIIQHPEGGKKKFSYGKILKVDGPFVYYEVNTEFGSSGSPVLRNLEVIAIHRSGKITHNCGTLCSAVIKDLNTVGKYFVLYNSPFLNILKQLWRINIVFLLSGFLSLFLRKRDALSGSS